MLYRVTALIWVFFQGIIAASKIGDLPMGPYSAGEVGLHMFIIAWSMLLAGLALLEWLAEKSESDNP